MSKDQEVEGKRKRSLKKESSPSKAGGDAKRSKSTSNDVRLFYAEEKEVEDRDPQKDLNLFKSTTADIRKCFKDVRDAKDKGGKQSNEVIETKKRETALNFVLLKKLNRLSHIRCKKARDATNEAKQRIDQYHLQLQNLLYETMHLEKEITKCLEFKSKDEEIELVPVEEFYNDAPTGILNKVEGSKKDPHQLRLARLDWELEQRKMLSQKLKESETSKDQLDKEIKTQQEYLENLQPKLNSILESTKPVQEYLGMPFDQIREQHQIAGHLPHPLYVLYMQTDAYRQACDKKLEVKIEGDIEAAESLKRTPDLLAEVEDSDSDQEEQEKKQSKRRRKTVDSGKIERKNKVLMKHPLSVVLKIKTKDGTCLQLTFWYLVTLEIVTVGIQLKTGTDSPPSCISGGDLLSPDLLLNEIYPGDTGNNSPNAANQYELRRLGLGDFNQYITDIGRPYLWAQWLSGLQFLGNKSSKVADTNVSMENMQETIRLLRRRINSRLSLLKQLSSLERGIVPLAPEAMALFPTKIVAKMSSWKRSTYSDFSALEYTSDVIENGMAKESDIFFVAVLERGSAKLSAQIVVTPDYPAAAPLIIVSLQWQTERTALNDINVQDMEEEVNVHYEELINAKSHDQILTNQLQRLLMCFDVYLETETQSAEEGPKEISKEKVYARLNRGPNRTKPYRFCPEVGIFSHR